MSISHATYLSLEEEMIAEMLEESKKTKEQLEEKQKKAPPLTETEKKLVLSELRDIEDITFDNVQNKEMSTTIVFHFKPISLFLDPGMRTGDIEDRKIPFYHLWRLGFIDFKTSKSRVKMQIVRGSQLNFNTVYDNPNKRNFHDWGLDCWGSWRQVIEELIKAKKYYDAVIHIATRMKQATVNDNNVSSFEKMCEFEYESKPYIFLNEQEALFFNNEVRWFMKNRNGGPKFILDPVNNVYYMDMTHRVSVPSTHSSKINTYRLAISNETRQRLERE